MPHPALRPTSSPPRSMYTVYPRAGKLTLSYVSAFNEPLAALKRMLELGFVQSRFSIAYPTGALGKGSG